MKKFNKNIIVFILAFAFIGLGFSIPNIKALVYRCGTLVLSVLSSTEEAPFARFTSDMDQYSTEWLQYRDALMDLDSFKQRCLNTKLIQKEDMLVVKAQDDTLIEGCERRSDEYINSCVSSVQDLQSTAEANGAEFLYIAAPTKNVLFSAPENTEIYAADNFDRYIKTLRNNNVPVLDLYDALCKEDMATTDTYFLTDHHWTPETGFWATEKICQALSDNYGFEYDQSYNDLENYTTRIYRDWFLGATGKKVGTYFTAGGADDITLIAPNFETSFTVTEPLKGTERTGLFEETILCMEHIETKDYHGLSPYSAYGGGDFRVQTIKNHLNPDGKKFLIVRDSFAGVVTPFLSLNASEVHILDVRNFIPAEPIDVYDYIETLSPDYVLVLYSGVEVADKFNFTTK